jgi:hypothetical protein
MLVQLAAEPIDLRFINAQATQNEVFLCRVPRRPRVVEAEEIDKRHRVKKEKAAERIFIRRTAEAALSTAASSQHQEHAGLSTQIGNPRHAVYYPLHSQR